MSDLIILAANSCWNIVNFRRPLVRALVERGYAVEVIAPRDAHSAKVEAMGARVMPIALSGSGVSPIEGLAATLAYARLLRARRPAAFLGFTAKPNIFGSLAAHALGIPVINNISGLGTAFLRPGLLQTLVAGLYRVALRRSATVFFQNPDDRALFVERRLVDQERTALLPGSGIDVDHFAPRPVDRANADRPFRFLLVARMLRDKGVVEYVEAARQLRAEGKAHFALLGPADTDNRSAIDAAQLAAWQAEGAVEYLGEAVDVRPHLAAADCIVLPSYREGLPRSLIEASAMGRPMIASDVPGCRSVVIDGETGLLCAVRSSASLAGAMARMIDMAPPKRAAMGDAARRKAVADFDEAKVVAAYLAALDAALRQSRPQASADDRGRVATGLAP